MSDSPYWFSPAPSELAVSRISLDFGLRQADRFFRELVVPELGRVWFVRQLSWPLAALAIHAELRRQGSSAAKPTAICHGIEALACKLEYRVDPEGRPERVLGRRAFGRDEESAIWSFQRLRQSSNYVRNTHRQAATRALRDEGGLGFVRGARFDLLELTKLGEELAAAVLGQSVGKGGLSLRKWLVGWVQGERDVGTVVASLRRALSPEHPTREEQDAVRSRVLESSTESGLTRQRLARAVGRAASPCDGPHVDGKVVPRLREAGHDKQADEVVAARAFGALLDRARDVIAELTRRIEGAKAGVPVSALARDRVVGTALATLVTAAGKFKAKASRLERPDPTSGAFVETLLAADEATALRFLAEEASGVLALADGAIARGPLFRVLDGADETNALEDGAASLEPDRTGRTFRMANFHALLRDLVPQGAS